MAPANQAPKKLTKEEELLLQDFSRNVSTKSSALFYGNAAIVAAVPHWLFWRVAQMEPRDSWLPWAVLTAVTTWLLAFAYKNTKFVLKHKIAQKREEAVSREIARRFADDKRVSKKEKDERVLWKKNEVADYEATNLAIFYNNAIFLLSLLVLSFFILANASPTLNYLVSMSVSAGLVALFSTGTK